jgi:hypothetical protein
MSDKTTAAKAKKSSDGDNEVVSAMGTVLSALRDLDSDARVHVVEFVIRRLGIQTGNMALLTQEENSALAPTVNVQEQPSPARFGAAADIRSLAAEKNPATVNEKVALVAYYLGHIAPPEERRNYIVSNDIALYFKQANFPLPKAQPSITLANAKNAGYLNALDRGQFKLNSVGYNLIAHKLPGAISGDAKRKSSRKPSKKKARAKRKK